MHTYTHIIYNISCIQQIKLKNNKSSLGLSNSFSRSLKHTPTLNYPPSMVLAYLIILQSFPFIPTYLSSARAVLGISLKYINAGL